MSGSVDDEVVRMRFDNNAFERGVAATLATLSKLKNSLNFTGADKGLDKIEAKASGFNMQGMTNGIEGVSKKFLALTTIGLTALTQITSRAISAGAQFAKSFTIGPIIDGFHEYETQLNSVQTILANTGLKGASGMSQVNGALQDLNTYSDKTIYNFSEMARNIGTFTAAGVKLKPATSAIKGIANVAALSGSSSEQASTAMYQLSQAIANNKVGLQDWNSVVNAGMGGKVFQQALFNVGKMKGTLKGVDANTTFDQWTKSGNSFRDSLKEGWITGDVLTTTLSQFTGDLTDAQLKSQGYNATQIKQIQEQAKTAQDAATKVKTFTQLLGTLKEAVGSGWAQSFQLIFGNFNEAKTLWTGISQSIGGLISNSAKARNKVLSDWKALGGRTVLIDGIKLAFDALGAVVKPIKQAFRDIFPVKTGKDLYNLTTRLHVFFENLKIGPETANNLKRTFAGFFALLDIGKQIVGGIFHVFAQLFGTLLHGSGGFLAMTANVGDMIVAFDKALKEGGLLNNFFRIITNVLTIPLHIFHLIGVAIGELFSHFHKGDADDVTNSVTGAGDALSHIADITQRVSDWFAGLSGKIKPGVDAVVNAFSHIGAAIANGLGSASFGNLLSTIQTGLLGGIVLLLKKFFANGFNIDVGGGFLGKAGEALDGLTGNLKAMQMQLKAKALLEIAIAIGVITASVVALSMIDAQKLTVAMKAMAVGFGELLAAMGILTKISSSAGFIKIPLMAASLDMLAVAILLLTAAVAAMSQLSWEELKKGLTAVGLLLLALSAASYPLSANSAGMIQAGVGITAMAIALNLLYFAVKNFSKMNWSDMAKGLGAVTASLAIMAGAMRLMPRGMVAQGAALILIASALNLLYLAVKNFAKLDWGQMVKGLVGVAGALVGIALGMKLMPPGMVLQAAALNLIGLALQGIGRAVASMSKMSWSAIGKGLTVLAGSLGILAAALYLMQGAVGGAAALFIVSQALRVFVPSLTALSKMPWGSILKGLGALAATFAVLGIASLVLAPVIPMMLALGVALGIVGIAMLAFGGGAALLGIGLTAIAASGGAAIAVLMNGLKGLIAMLPLVATSIATAFVNFVTIIGKNAPAIIGAFVKLLNGLLQAVPKIMPSLIRAIESIVEAILKVLVDEAPNIVRAGFKLLLDLLSGIRDNIGKITTTVASIIVKFLDALADNMPRIIAAGVRLLTKFLVGIASALGQMPSIVLKVIAAFLSSLFGNFGKIFSGGARLLGKLVSGIGSALGNITSAAGRVIARFVTGIASGGANLIGAGVRMLGNIAHGIFTAIGEAVAEAGEAALAIGRAIVDGIKDGIGDIASTIGGVLKDGIGGAIGAVGDFLGIGGPSMTFSKMIGEHIPEGIAHGIDKNAGAMTNSLRSMSKASVLAMKKTIAGLSSSIADNVDYNPTITPVLDLTQVNKDAAKISSIVSMEPVNARVSFSQASDISNLRQAVQEAAATTPATEPTVTKVELTQNNYSPKPISSVDLYRQTNNQLSQAKKALGVLVTEKAK